MRYILFVCDWIANHIAIMVLGIAAVALFFPSTFTFIHPTYINCMLGIVMFGMGLTLKGSDFKVLLSRPRDVIIGCIAQFTVMPLLAWILCHLFRLPAEISIGVILVGCCPGGTASNVITYLAKGDLALSVGMTGLSTLLAPFLTPLLTYLLAGETVDVNMWNMFVSILQVVILPIALGFVINHYFRTATERVLPFLPTLSTLTIALIVACIVSVNSSRIWGCSMLILTVVVLHNVCGLVLGYSIGKLLGLSRPKRNAISIEVGMQNSGLATSLAATHFAQYPLAAIPGAIFSVWHNFSGAIVANYYKSRSVDDHSRNEE